MGPMAILGPISAIPGASLDTLGGTRSYFRGSRGARAPQRPLPLGIRLLLVWGGYRVLW